MADGTPGMITHFALLGLSIGDHKESVICFVTKLQYYQVILGVPWVEQHDPFIDWKTRRLIFDSDHCCLNYNHGGRPTSVFCANRNSHERKALVDAHSATGTRRGRCCSSSVS